MFGSLTVKHHDRSVKRECGRGPYGWLLWAFSAFWWPVVFCMTSPATVESVSTTRILALSGLCITTILSPTRTLTNSAISCNCRRAAMRYVADVLGVVKLPTYGSKLLRSRLFNATCMLPVWSLASLGVDVTLLILVELLFDPLEAPLGSFRGKR